MRLDRHRVHAYPGHGTEGLACSAASRGAPWRRDIDAASKKQLLQELTEAEAFETFCQKRFVGTKRFGLEGGESTIPALHTMIRTGARARRA